MRIFVPPVEIGDKEGFSSEKDIFDRKKLGEGLKSLVSTVADPLVIAIDGDWGSGKTTFLKMWAGELRKADFPVIYLDAFEHDYVADPFAAIAGQIVSLAEGLGKNKESDIKPFVEKATRVAKIFLRHGLKLGVRVGTLGVLQSADIAVLSEDFAKDLSKEVSDAEDKYFGELLTKQKEERELIDSFKVALGELSSLLSDGGPEGEQRPLVFIIDELDRCRPTFALSLLERIKHFFLTDKVCFVIGVNFKQLNSSVRLCYGQDVDADYYLQKFFHLRAEITVDAEYPQCVEKYVEFLIKRHEIEGHILKRNIEDCVVLAAKRRGFSFRTIERLMSHICLALPYNFPPTISPVVIGLLIMKVSAPNLYDKARRQLLRKDEAFEALGLDVLDERSENRYRHIRAIWLYCTQQQISDEFSGAIQNLRFFSKEDPVVDCMQNIVDRLILISR